MVSLDSAEQPDVVSIVPQSELAEMRNLHDRARWLVDWIGTKRVGELW